MIDQDLMTQTWAHVEALLGSEMKFMSWCTEDRKRVRDAKNSRAKLHAEELREEHHHGSDVGYLSLK